MFSVECSMFDVHSQVSPLINPSPLGGSADLELQRPSCVDTTVSSLHRSSVVIPSLPRDLRAKCNPQHWRSFGKLRMTDGGRLQRRVRGPVCAVYPFKVAKNLKCTPESLERPFLHLRAHFVATLKRIRLNDLLNRFRQEQCEQI